MRIAQVIHAFPPYSVGGSENYTLALSKELQRRGHQVSVFHRIADFTKEEYAVEEAELEGLPVWKLNHIFRYHDRFEKLYRDEEIDKRFSLFLESFRPDVVHLHHLTCLSTSSVFEAKKRACALVMTLHDYWLICQRGQFLKPDLALCPGQNDHECVKCLTRELSIGETSRKFTSMYRQVMPEVPVLRKRMDALLRKVYLPYRQFRLQQQDSAVAKVHSRMEHMREICEQIDLFLAPSHFLETFFLKFGIPAAKLLYSDNGYDTASFHQRGRRRRQAGEKLRFGFIGVVFPPKGVHILVEAFRNIGEDEAELIIHGNIVPYEGFDGYGERLQRIAAGRQNIHFAGPYHASEVGRILDSLDVLVVPSVWYENSPLTIHEAFLAQVPVLTANLGGMSELVQDEVNGLLFRPRDFDDLHDKIRRLIREPELVTQLAECMPAVKTIAEDAADMEERYLALCAGQSVARRTI